MGVYNRDYMRDESGGGGIPHPKKWSVVTWLLVLNAAYYLIDVIGFDNAHHGMVSRDALMSGHVYLLITYMFVHGSVIHLAANMILLFFVGRMLLKTIGTRAFLMVYFGGGFLGAILQLVVFPGNLLGASAGCIGVLIALATLIPLQEIYLMIMFILPVKMKMRTIAFIVVGYDVFAMVAGLHPEIGHLAHLGGALFGFVFIKWIYPRIQARTDSYGRQDQWQERWGTRQVVDAEVVEERPKKLWQKKKKKTEDATFVSEDVDAILDKISEKGLHSLTAREKKILEKSSEKLSRKIDGR